MYSDSGGRLVNGNSTGPKILIRLEFVEKFVSNSVFFHTCARFLYDGKSIKVLEKAILFCKTKYIGDFIEMFSICSAFFVAQTECFSDIFVTFLVKDQKSPE